MPSLLIPTFIAHEPSPLSPTNTSPSHTVPPSSPAPSNSAQTSPSTEQSPNNPQSHSEPLPSPTVSLNPSPIPPPIKKHPMITRSQTGSLNQKGLPH